VPNLGTVLGGLPLGASPFSLIAAYELLTRQSAAMPRLVVGYARRFSAVPQNGGRPLAAMWRRRSAWAVATRYDKRERIYQGTIDVASIRIWLRDPVS